MSELQSMSRRNVQTDNHFNHRSDAQALITLKTVAAQTVLGLTKNAFSHQCQHRLRLSFLPKRCTMQTAAERLEVHLHSSTDLTDNLYHQESHTPSKHLHLPRPNTNHKVMAILFQILPRRILLDRTHCILLDARQLNPLIPVSSRSQNLCKTDAESMKNHTLQ